jgi:hypothetical protein
VPFNTSVISPINKIRMLGNESWPSTSTASTKRRRAPARSTSVSGPSIEILSGCENETNVSSYMAYPSFLEIGFFDNRQDTPRSHRPITEIRA